MLKMNNISRKDADFRLNEFKTYYTVEPKAGNYPFDKMKEIWPEGNYFDVENVEGFCGDFEDGFLFIFRGTDSLLGWLRNFMFSKKVIPYEGTNPKIKVHNGFLKTYKAIREFVHEQVKGTEKTKIYVHGHSLGGALTTLAALDIQYNFADKEVIAWGIGIPKVGNEAFKDSFNRRLPKFLNIERASDLIPQVPPRFFGFRHAGNLIHIGTPRRKGIGTHEDHNWNLYYEDLEKDLDDTTDFY